MYTKTHHKNHFQSYVTPMVGPQFRCRMGHMFGMDFYDGFLCIFCFLKDFFRKTRFEKNLQLIWCNVELLNIPE